MSFHNETPAPVPAVLSRALAGLIANQAERFDIAIGDVPFLLKPSDQDPYVRDLAQDQKEQFDSSGEAGENSFGQWWLRSQHTFHGGAGQQSVDALSRETPGRLRFESSTQLDPHTPGELKLAPSLAKDATYPAAFATLVEWSAVSKLVFASTTTNQITVRNTDLSLDQNVTIGAAGIPAAVTSNGVNVFVAINNSIYRVDPGSPATVVQTHSNLTFNGPVQLEFVKDRLVLAIGPKLWELAPSPAAPPVDMALVTPHHAHTALGWRYTSIADGPNGIYVAGFAGSNSTLSFMSVSEVAGALELGQPIVQLQMPPAEIIRDVLFYIDSFFVLATSRGARVGSFTPYGQVQMGPLTIEDVSCHSLAAASEQVWVGAVDSVWRIDLSTPVDKRFAHARLASGFATGSSDCVNSITVLPSTGLLYATLSSAEIVSQNAAVFAVDGSLTTAWTRFDTVESKQLHYVRVDGDFPGIANAVTVKVEADTGEAVEFTINGSRPSYEFSTAGLVVAQRFRLTFTIREPSVVLRSYQLKALPASRLFGENIVPLACFDFETDRSGQELGYRGFAADRLRALEDIVNNNVRVTVTDRLLDESFQCVVRRSQFRQTDPPAIAGSLGGVVSVILRRV